MAVIVTWIIDAIAVVMIIFLLFFIKCHPLITFINLFTHLFFTSFNFGENIIIDSKDIVIIENKVKISLLNNWCLFRMNSIEIIPISEEIRNIIM